MQVVLLENLKNVGKIGDVIKVKRGYARNFLIKFKKALIASKENILEVNKRKELSSMDFAPNGSESGQNGHRPSLRLGPFSIPECSETL